MTGAPNGRQWRERAVLPLADSFPKTSFLRRSVFRTALIFLIAIPSCLFVAALSPYSALNEFLAPHTAFWFPVWAVFAVWVTLDAPALYGFIGPRPDPFGPKAIKLSILGIANVAALFLFLIFTNGN
jgi:hypothetical protein